MPFFVLKETEHKLIVAFTAAKVLSHELPEFQGSLAAVCDRASELGKACVVFDFQGVQFMTSGIIGELVLINRRAKIDFRIRNVSPNVREIFAITKLNKVFRYDDSDDDGPDLTGSPVPLPRGPKSDAARANPPQDVGEG